MKMGRVFVYNSVMAFQLLLSLCFQLVFAKKFGISADTDGYFIAMAIFELISSFGLLLTYMFLQFYNDMKSKDLVEAERFYQAVFTVTVVLGFAALLVSYFLIDQLVFLFAPGFGYERSGAAVSYFKIMCFSLLWYRLINLNNLLINAEMRFLLPYVLSLVTPFFNLSALFFFSDQHGINSVAYSTVISSFLVFLVGQWFIRRHLNIRLAPVLYHRALPGLFKKSFSLKASYQLVALKEAVATNMLSRLDPGAVSCYYYAFRIISAIYNLALAPLYQLFVSGMSKAVSAGDEEWVRRETVRFLKYNLIFFFCAVFPASLALKKLLMVFFGDRFSASEINAVFFSFLSLIPFFSLLSAEAPFSSFLVSFKKTGEIAFISVAFMAVFLVSAWASAETFKIYALPLSLFAGQAVSLVLYIRRYIHRPGVE